MQFLSVITNIYTVGHWSQGDLPDQEVGSYI